MIKTWTCVKGKIWFGIIPSFNELVVFGSYLALQCIGDQDGVDHDDGTFRVKK